VFFFFSFCIFYFALRIPSFKKRKYKHPLRSLGSCCSSISRRSSRSLTAFRLRIFVEGGITSFQLKHSDEAILTIDIPLKLCNCRYSQRRIAIKTFEASTVINNAIIFCTFLWVSRFITFFAFWCRLEFHCTSAWRERS